MAGWWGRIAITAVIALVATACSLSGGGSGPTDAPVPPEAQAAVDAARQAASTDLALDPSAITVVSVEPQEWPDTSLGCPEPGMLYGQMITPGYIVVLEADGTTHEYHADASGQQAVTCPG